MEHMPVEIGDFTPATLVERIDTETWLVKLHESPNGWTVRLRINRNELWNSGDSDLFRIYRAVEQQREIWLTTSNRGFLPISDRMRPRYRKAVRAVLLWMEQAYEQDSDDFLVSVQEVKGMFNRCIRRDQLDWFEVWAGLGKPANLDMKRVVQLLTDWRTVKDDFPEALSIASRLRRLDVHSRLNRFLGYLDVTQESLPRVEPDQKGHRSPGSSSCRKLRPIQSKHTKMALDFANREHRTTLEALITTLEKSGYLTERNTFVDLFARLWSGPAIFEIKSISHDRDNELSQARYGVSQLYEYAYRHGYSGIASLWLVFSTKPSSTWLIPYLTEDRDIQVMWLEYGNLVGPSAHKLVR